MSGESVTFSIFLKDYFSKELDKIGYKGGHAFTKLHSGFNNIINQSNKAAGGVGKLNQNLDGLARERHVKINTNDISKAHRELDKLEVARTRLEKPKTGGAGSGGAGMGLITKAGIYGAAIGALYKGGQFIGDSITKYDEGAQADAQLQAGLKSTKGISGKTMGGMTAQAQNLQDVTKFDDEATKGAQAILLTFTQVRNKIFDEAIPAIQDMATRMKTDLPTAALQVGKALNDPIGGIGALRRVGVQLTDEQEKQVKTYVKLGQVEKAQAIILKELNTEFGGSAAAAAKAGTGGFTILKNKFDDLKEGVGARLMPALGALGTELGKVVGWAKEYTNVSLTEEMKNQRTEVESLVAAINDQNTPAERRNELYRELVNIAPQFSNVLKNEKFDYAELNKQLIAYNDQLEKKLRLQSMQDKSNKYAAEYFKTQNDLKKRNDDIKESIDKITEAVEKQNSSYKRLFKNLNERWVTGKIDTWTYGKSILNMTADQNLVDGVSQQRKFLESYLYGTWALPWAQNDANSLPGLFNKMSGLSKDKKKIDDEYSKLSKQYGINDPSGKNTATNAGIDAKGISSIGSGGASVKQITINLDSIIHSNTNIFDAGQDPKDAQDFMTKLTDALQMIVNDVNYSN